MNLACPPSLVHSGLEILPGEQNESEYDEEAKERDNDNYR